MTNTFWKSLLVTPALFATALAGTAVANEPLQQWNNYASEGRPMSQVTSVSQLRDVKPTDWAFQALQSLVERYGCIAGYPDGTFRGNRAMTRYEFAAGLNACLDRVNELIASATADLVSKEDLAVLQRLQEEFQAELATLRGRVDALEAKTARLEAQQFSTTTKLVGTAILDVGSAITGEVDTVNGRDPVDSEVTLGGSVRLDLNTSFTGQDLLKMALNVQQIQGYAARTGAPEAELFHTVDPQGNRLRLEEMWYRFPVGKATVYAGIADLFPDDVVPSIANFQGDSVADYFGNNPLSYDLPGGAGAGFNLQLAPQFNVAAGYFAQETADGIFGSASVAGADSGLTGGPNTAFAQLTFTPSDKLVIAGTFARAYTTDGLPGGLFTAASGTAFVRDPITLDAPAASEAFTTNAVGLNAAFKVSPAIDISGWAGFGWADSKDSSTDANLFNWAVNLGLPDFLRKGNYAGVSVGSPTHVTDADNTLDEQDAPFMAQAFYRFKVTDNISIQPGVVYIANPAGSEVRIKKQRKKLKRRHKKK